MGTCTADTLNTLEDSVCQLWVRQPPTKSEAEFPPYINVLNSNNGGPTPETHFKPTFKQVFDPRTSTIAAFLTIYETAMRRASDKVNKEHIMTFYTQPAKSCKDLAGFAFKFGNSLPSTNGSGSISTHSGLLYLSVIDPGMTSSQRDPLSHSVFLMSNHCPLSTI
ncbi:hypothetical protein DSO57_1032397 [Entomophthora muscae]|uniref:Uncharacterized protein n=1 Tax=Entomophthora muscae TaxID=34485 RepID=A0ACC2RRE0_9FUNG|nr:hypothetical protein DSO57_1032397 [Entomophthora muscae]